MGNIMKEGQSVKVLCGFGHPKEIPGFVKQKGYHVERVELHYLLDNHDLNNQIVKYQYWFFENGDAIAIHQFDVGGYSHAYPFEEGIRNHKKDLEKIAEQINPLLKVSVIQRRKLDYPSSIPWRK